MADVHDNTGTTPSPTSIAYGNLYGHLQFSHKNSRILPEPDVQVLTSDGLRIPAHSSILASVSSVLEGIMDNPRKHRSSQILIPVLGVPCDAVSAFLRFIYYGRCREEDLEKFGIHMLALSHVYQVPQLKQRCAKDVGRRLTAENVVDVLQLARLCDAPDLYLKSLKSITYHYMAVEKTEGWKFMQNHDPFLELEILRFIDENESRKKRTRRRRKEQSLYMELSVAMDCLEHICTQGCTSVGPYDGYSNEKRVPCSKFYTCQGLQLLIKHFATCKNRISGRCSRCKRMWQLLRLHSSICDQLDSCRVPLCRQFKLEMQQEEKGEAAALWKMLVSKVKSARVMSSLSLQKRKREEEEHYWIMGLGPSGDNPTID